MSLATAHPSNLRRTSPVWSLLLAAHAVALVVGASSDPLLLPVAVASTALLIFVWAVMARGAILCFLLPIWYCWWTTLTLGYANLAYVRFTTFPVGGSHELTAWMTALATACAAVGATCAHLVIGRDRLPSRATPLVLRWELLAVSGAFFLFFVLASLSTGALTARWEYHEADTGGLRYLVGGLGTSVYVVFFFLGTHIGTSLFSRRSLAVLATVGAFALAQGLTGGRGISLFMVILMLGGAAWRGELPSRQMAPLVVVVLIAGFVFATVVQTARGRPGFGHGSVEDRVTMMREGAGELSSDETASDDAWQVFLARIFEPSGQDVIDQTVRTQHFAGFEDFDRLENLFLPLALAPDKRPVSDGKEILERDFGYQLGPLTGVPIMLVADAYRRGAAPWVAAVGFAVGAMLRLLTRLTLLALGPDLALVCLLIYMLPLAAITGESVTGAISVLTYQWVKYALITTMLGFAMRLMLRLSQAPPAAGLMRQR